jgi:hypothetical protein
MYNVHGVDHGTGRFRSSRIDAESPESALNLARRMGVEALVVEELAESGDMQRMWHVRAEDDALLPPEP